MVPDWGKWIANNYPGRRRLLNWLVACAYRFKPRLELPEAFEHLDAVTDILDKKLTPEELTTLRIYHLNKLVELHNEIRGSASMFMKSADRLRAVNLFRELFRVSTNRGWNQAGITETANRLRGQMASLIVSLAPWAMRSNAQEQEELEQFKLYQCVCTMASGLDPSWLSWNDYCIPRMAKSIYEEKRFGEMPIIGDALEEAGCDNPDIVAHCRENRVHFRGCWVIDCILWRK